MTFLADQTNDRGETWIKPLRTPTQKQASDLLSAQSTAFTVRPQRIMKLSIP